MGEGRTESDAVRTALSEAGSRRVRRSALVAEAAALAADATDTKVVQELMADMATVEADWPS